MKDLIRMARARAHESETETEGLEAAEAGFTLIELMVVLLIIAILLAIAIPTFLGVTNTAGDRAAQSNLSNALTESAALYQVTASYSSNSGTFNAALLSQAPEFTWTTGACLASSTNCVSELPFSVVTTGDNQGLSLAVDSTKTNTCWLVFDLQAAPGTPITATSTIPTAGVFYAKSTSIPAGGCVALNPTSTALNLTGGTNYGSAATVTD
jgi:type IV pilus assembly protein PilA